jgi:hypothetical protein
VFGDLDAIDHERDQVQGGQILGEQLGQGVLGRGHEPARHRRLRGPGGGLLHRAADRLKANLIATGRELSKHPLQGELVQQLGGGERLPGGQGQLGGAVGAADPRPVDPHTPAAEGDLAGLGAVADRGTGGVVAPFGAGQPLDVSVQQASQHPQAGPHREREEAFAGRAGQLAQRDRDLLGQDQLGIGGHGRLRMLGHVAVPSGRAAWSLPDTYHTAGIRRGPPPQVPRSPGQPRTSGFGYFLEMATRPQMIGYALLDSPVALAAWLLDHDTDSYEKIARAFVDGEPAGNLTRDNILDNITLYWLTGTGASAARSYWEDGHAAAAAAASGQAPPQVSIPVGFTTFPGEIWATPRSWAENSYPTLTYFNEVDKGGHFAAWEEPRLFSEEVRAAFRSLR